jgi:micrococcal nuclease
MLHAMCRYHEKASLVGAFFVCALLVCAQALAEPGCRADRIDEWATVARVYDGDTLRLDDRRVLRFIGINAPELGHEGRAAQPLAIQAKQSLMRMLPVGSRVGLRYDNERRDRHHRLLAHVFDAQRRNISARLLHRGEAFAVAVAPNLWHSACYFRQEAAARQQHRGIWGLAYYRPRAAGTLRSREGGFYRVRGRIDHIGRSRRSLWLDMGDGFALRIPRKRLGYFSDLHMDTWLNKIITVRGWARFYNNKLNMTITHPAMIETTP